MSNEAKYFDLLSRAVASIETDSFEARGSAYDRLWAFALKRLEDSGVSAERIATERAAFLSAVRRVEFGERPTVTEAVQNFAPERVAPERVAPEQVVPEKLAPERAKE